MVGLYSSTVGTDTVAGDFQAPNAYNQTTTYSGWARGDFFENLPVFPDSDSDGMAEGWELAHFTTLAIDGTFPIDWKSIAEGTSALAIIRWGRDKRSFSIFCRIHPGLLLKYSGEREGRIIADELGDLIQ